MKAGSFVEAACRAPSVAPDANATVLARVTDQLLEDRSAEATASRIRCGRHRADAPRSGRALGGYEADGEQALAFEGRDWIDAGRLIASQLLEALVRAQHRLTQRARVLDWNLTDDRAAHARIVGATGEAATLQRGMTTIAILHPGEMGAEIGRTLVERGHRVCWLPHERSGATRRRAEDAGLIAMDSLDGCEIVVSVCPPEFAQSTARRLTRFSGLYIDANAISPQGARAVAETVSGYGAGYVDGGIIGPPPSRAGTTRLYLAGAGAEEAAAAFEGSRIEARVLEGELSASSLKMSYAAWTKTSAALLLAIRETAASLGVERALLAEWKLSQPALLERSEQASSSAVEKGWRWEAEMREVARTLAAAGQPGEFGSAAAELFARYPRPREEAE